MSDTPEAPPGGRSDVTLRLTLNGAACSATVPVERTAADLLRDDLRLTGTRIACSRGVCGACVALVDGVPAATCSMFAFQLDGCTVQTIEGLAQDDGQLHPVQQAFVEQQVPQCSWCMSGQMMTAAAFLENTPRSTLWPHAFDLLARVLEELDTPPPDVIMRWMVEGGAALRQSGAAEAEVALFRGHAMLALSRWLLHEGRKQEALGLLESMAVAHPEHPQAVDAMRLALQTHGALGNDTAVAALASLWRGHFEEGGASFLDFITGGSAFVRGDYEDAADDFFAAANTAATLSARRAALFNACVAALRAGELLLYQTLLGQLQIVGSGSEVAVKSGDSAADLELDRAL